MYGYWIVFLLVFLAAALSVLAASGTLLRLKLYFMIKRTQKKSNPDEFDRVLSTIGRVLKREELLQLESILALKKTDLFGAYLGLLKLTGKKDNAVFKHCNIFRGKNISVFVCGDKIVLSYKGRRFYGAVFCGEARLKTAVHTLNKTEYYFESGEKIFKGTLLADSGALVYFGEGEIKGSLRFAGRKNKLRFNFTGGIYENPFLGIDGYVLDKQNFIALFDRLSEAVISGEEYPFDSIDIKGLVSIPLKNHFELSYKIIEEREGIFDRASGVKILELLAAFGTEIIYNHTLCGQTVKSRHIMICKNDLPLAVCPRLESAVYNCPDPESQMSFKSEGLKRAFASLTQLCQRLKQKANRQTDIFTLLLLSYAADGGDRKELLSAVLKHQLIDGNFIRYSNTKSGIFDKNDKFSMLFPIFLSYFIKSGDRDFLDAKYKYSTLTGGKTDGAAVYGDTEKIYPADMVYEHAVKCFELFDFKDDFIKTDFKEHIGGFFKGVIKNKNLIFTLLYLYSVGSAEEYLTEGDYKKFVGFSRGLMQKVKTVLGSKEFLRAEKTEKLIICAFAEAAIKDGQFLSSFEFTDFYDFFESYAASKSRVKELDTATAVIYILGAVFCGGANQAFVFAGELLNLMTASGEGVLKEKLCYDGERFYFDGNDDVNLSLLFYGLLKNRILGITLSGGRLAVANPADKLDGETISITASGRCLNVLLKKSGKNRITVGGTVYTNIKNYPLEGLSEDTECIVEF